MELMYLTDEDLKMLDGTVEAMHNIFNMLRDMHVKEAVKDLSQFDEATQAKYARKDQKDTRYFDIVGEDFITFGSGFPGHLNLMERIYSKSGVVITEERGRLPRQIRIEHDTPTIISDPVDGSSYFDDVLKRLSTEHDRVGIVFDRERERVGDAAARRHACNTSVTLIRDNQIKYTVVLNLLTGDIYVGSPRGVFRGDVREVHSFSHVNTPIEFDGNEGLTMLCYTRDTGKYENNRKGTHLRFFPLHETSKREIGPIGPIRFSYLVRFGDEESTGIKVVAHNGEKIQESLPTIAIAAFSKGDLQAYKLFCDEEYTEQRGGKDLTPNLANSLYSDGLLVNTGVRSVFLNNYDYPSEFRDTTAVISARNDAAVTMFTGMVERQYAVRIV